MNDIETKISNLKKDTFEAAYKESLIISNFDKQVIGKLIPIGKWILSDNKKIKNLTLWREKNMKFFFSQFKSSHDRTVWYLENLSINKKNRILFLIYTEENEFVGHIGLADIFKDSAFLDNLIRGKSSGNSKLIYFSIITLINWFFKNFDINKVYGKIISYNWLAISLHEDIGFKIIDKISLKKIQENEEINHINVDPSNSNVRYFCTKVLLNKNEFYKNIN